MLNRILFFIVIATGFLAFQRSWLTLASLAVACFLAREHYIRLKMIEFRRSTTPGKLKSRLSFLPYSEVQFNKDLGSVMPHLKSRMQVFDHRQTFHTSTINFQDGLRKTSFVPINQVCTNKIYLFGGSTTLCIEVPDDFTIASQLQKNILSGSPPLPLIDYEVVNCGVRGASLKANYAHFRSFNFLRGDICIFFFGCNEYNLINWSPIDFKLKSPFPSKLQQISDRLGKHGFFSLNRALSKFFIFDENSPKFDERAQNVGNIFKSIESLCQVKKLKLFAVLQPDMFSRVPESQFYKKLVWHYRSEEFRARRVLNDKIEKRLKMESFFYDGRSIMNDSDLDVYIDWVHTNYLGNKIIADFFYSEIYKHLQKS